MVEKESGHDSDAAYKYYTNEYLETEKVRVNLTV
jgi:hypothetical protein